MIADFEKLAARLDREGLGALANRLPELFRRGLDETRYGDLPFWYQAYEAMPDVAPGRCILDADKVTVGSAADASASQLEQLEASLRQLHPWRKGPFDIFGIHIDTEWRSDFKWRRLVSAIEPLQGRKVLDIGCGNGYHCWRMAGAGANFVLGIDPAPLFFVQFQALQKYIRDDNVWFLPARSEQLPAGLKAFDTVFSMGVLYHRRSPIDHLLELREALADGGQLVLETLVIEGDAGDVLVPEGRYARMGNVWFIPSVQTLCGWLRKIKFQDVGVVDVSQTSFDEQRATSWMTFQSLRDFLDPADATRTVEGYPAPRRAILVATAPAGKKPEGKSRARRSIRSS